MVKKKSYVPRLILFGNHFNHSVLDLMGGMVEEFDLSNNDFGSMMEANVLLQYVTHFKERYSKAVIVYAYDEKGLIFHHMHMEGPCFKLQNTDDVRKLKLIRSVMNDVLLANFTNASLIQMSAAICKRVKFLPNISNKKALNASCTVATNAQNLMVANAKQVIVDFMAVNFLV